MKQLSAQVWYFNGRVWLALGYLFKQLTLNDAAIYCFDNSSHCSKIAATLCGARP